MTVPTPAEEHSLLVRTGVEQYRDFFGVAISWLFQGGKVPGLEVVSSSKLRSFFEQTSPTYWTQLMQTNPSEAMSQLIQWANSDKQNAELHPSEVM